jgi:hypothetical protein
VTAKADPALRVWHRFVWRAVSKTRWYSVSFKTDDTNKALASLKRHFKTRLKLSLDDVVVDHMFYREVTTRIPEGEDAAWPYQKEATPLSLQDLPQSACFQQEFKNRVLARRPD